VPVRQSIHVRLPRALHEHLVATAIEQDISLNGLIATLLAGATGFNLAPEQRSPGTVEAVRGTTTHGGTRASQPER
jgi:hypothetical protein